MKKFYCYYVLSLVLAIMASAPVNAQTDWAGTYTLRSNNPLIYNMDDYNPIGDLGLTDKMPNPESFTVVIENVDGQYMVTKFADFDLTAPLADGPIALEVKDDKTAYMATNDHVLYGYTYEYEGEDENGELTTLTDTVTVMLEGEKSNMNNPEEPLKLTKQSDGQIKLSNFVLVGYKERKTILGWYDKNTPLNGGDPDEQVQAYDWAGTYLVDASGMFKMDETLDFPERFLMTIAEDAWNPGSYVITEFWGRDGLDDVMLNAFTGGIPMTLDEEDGDVAYIVAADGQNLLETVDGGFTYYVVTDGFGLGQPIRIEHLDDDTFTIDAFTLSTYSLLGEEAEQLIYCFSATAKKGDREALEEELAAGIAEVEQPAASVERCYDLSGLQRKQVKGINIVQRTTAAGKVVTKKVIVK